MRKKPKIVWLKDGSGIVHMAGGWLFKLLKRPERK